MQQHHLSVMDLVTRLAPEGAVEGVTLERLASWQHPGLVTALQVRSVWNTLTISSKLVHLSNALEGFNSARVMCWTGAIFSKIRVEVLHTDRWWL